jgi:hypothetical protein
MLKGPLRLGSCGIMSAAFSTFCRACISFFLMHRRLRRHMGDWMPTTDKSFSTGRFPPLSQESHAQVDAPPRLGRLPGKPPTEVASSRNGSEKSVFIGGRLPRTRP